MKLAAALAALFLALPAAAAETADDCASARDPERCAARQAALKACADKRRAEKRACLDAAMPPVDCAKASDPARCEAIRKAKEACQGKTGKALKACLRDEKPKKAKKKRPSA